MKKPDFFNRVSTESEGKLRRRSFISFGVFALVNALGFAGWKWLNKQTQDTGVLKPLRKTLETNEDILSATFSQNRLVKTYTPAEAVKNVRRNGSYGLQQNIDVNTWRLNVAKDNSSALVLSLDDIKKLPKKDIVFNFKCVEGWSQVQHWGGVAFRDFIMLNGLQAQTKMQYVGMQTPDKKYYVGLDMMAAMHPQTLLCYEMNGQPLEPAHGAPLRLIIPVKYGIKNLKCIGAIFFSNQKPPDYWAERGYDYYAGL